MAQGMARAPETAGEPVTVTMPVPVPQGHTLEGQRSLPTPFLTKTYRLVDDPAMDDVISWNEDGSTFVVWRPAEFARDILPKYFKHNNFSSFVRQLNTYGFRKIVPDRWEFANDCFRRGEKRLLCDIHRRKIVANATSVAVAATAAVPPPQAPAIPVAAIPLAVPMTRVISPVNSGEEQVLSSNSSPGPPSATAGSGGGAELKEENERLRKENAKLSRELTHMKNLCNHISVLISQCSSGQQNGHGGAGQRTTPTEDDLSAAPVLELMPGGRGAEDAVDYMEDVEAPATTAAVKAEEVTSAPAVPLPPPPPGPCPRLFGVPLGLKRGRPEEDGEDMETEGPHALPEVKPEPEDSGSEPKEGSPEPKRAWVIYCPRPTRPACDGSDRGGGREREPDGACT